MTHEFLQTFTDSEEEQHDVYCCCIECDEADSDYEITELDVYQLEQDEILNHELFIDENSEDDQMTDSDSE